MDLFSNAKRKMINENMMDMLNRQQIQKEAAMNKQRKNLSPEIIQKYLMALIQMKGNSVNKTINLLSDMENSYYLQCSKICVDLKGEAFLNDKERECLSDCNKKIQKFNRIAQDQFKSVDDEIKQVQHLNLKRK